MLSRPPEPRTFVFIVRQVLHHYESGCVLERQRLSNALVVGIEEDAVHNSLLCNLLVEALHAVEGCTEKRSAVKQPPTEGELTTSFNGSVRRFLSLSNTSKVP